MLFGPAVVVIRRVVVALVLSVFVGVTAIAQATPAWAAQVTATITVGTSPFGVAVSPDGTKAYVTNLSSNNVSVINTADNTVDATITVGTTPEGVAVSPDGTKAYVANFNDDNVSVINTTTNVIDATITVGTDPYGVAVSPDGTTAYVTNYGSNNVSVIDLLANASASASADTDPGVPGIFLTVAGPVGRSASEAPIYYGADRVAVTSTYLLTVTHVSNVTPTITTLAQATIDADGSFTSMTRLPALAPGTYNVQMVGTHVNGSTLQLTSQVTIGGLGQFTSIGANIPVIR
jgi:YVTN family beta-propeller protein